MANPDAMKEGRANPTFPPIPSFQACLWDARRVTGRNRDTGQLETNEYAGSWIGAVAYMILLDQIGGCFKPKNEAPVNRADIYKALSYFTELGEREINAIYALRCALAHDYSLYNIPPPPKKGKQKPKERPELKHRFQLTQGTDTLVKLPDVPWDGDYHNDDLQSLTVIDVQKLGDLVEKVVQDVENDYQAGRLDIVLEGGKDELGARYTIFAFRGLA